MIKFDIKEGKLVIDAKFLMFDAFTNIWKSDKTKNKDKATKLLRYVFHFCDLSEDNPIKDTIFSKKEEEAKFLVFNKRDYVFSDKEFDLIEPAIECYNKYNVTADERILEVYNKKLDQLQATIEGIKPEVVRNINDTNGKVEFSSNMDIITKGLKEIDNVLEARNKVRAKVQNSSSDTKVRGGLKRSALSKGLLKNKRG